MKAVWSLWTKPLLQSASQPWGSQLHHWLSWVLSVQTASKHFEELQLVTDTLGQKLLVERLQLPFTSVVTTLDRLDDHNSQWWAIGKLEAYKAQQSPFVHIDSDAFLWKSLPERLLNADVLAQSPERFRKGDDSSYYKVELVERLVANHNGWLPEQWSSYTSTDETLIASCCGIIGGNNTALLKEYAILALQIVEHPANQVVWSNWPQLHLGNVLVEQMLLNAVVTSTSNASQPSIEYLFEEDSSPFDPREAAKVGYTHLISGSKTNTELLLHLEERVSAEYPTYFDACKRLAESELLLSTTKRSTRKSSTKGASGLPVSLVAVSQREVSEWVSQWSFDLAYHVETTATEPTDHRYAAIAKLRSKLLSGEPVHVEGIAWPEYPLLERLVDWIENSGIVEFCVGEPEIVDAFLIDLLKEVDQYTLRVSQSISELDESAEDKEIQTIDNGDLTKDQLRRMLLVSIKTAVVASKQAEVIVKKSEAVVATENLQRRWRERIQLWQDIQIVFGALGRSLGLGWDLGRGILKRRGWHNLTALADLLSKLPKIRDLITSLGRLRDETMTDDSGMTCPTLFRSVSVASSIERQVFVPRVPGDTKGIERSDDIQRMLPVEAAMLTDPVLEMLWHAKRAERALLTYTIAGQEMESISLDREIPTPESRKRINGPIISCVDTSASMQGTPEVVAKAFVLEAARIAHSEGRECLVYAFSGPDQFESVKLPLSSDGIDQLLDFLELTFDGGTDPSRVLDEALAKIETNNWARADIVVVSDGEFWIDAAQANRIDTVINEKGCHLAGVLVGREEDNVMKELCEPLLVFPSWDEIVCNLV